MALISAGTVLAFVTGIQIFSTSKDPSFVPLFFAGTLIIGIGIYIWIRRGITLSYKLRMAERKIRQLEDELADINGKYKRLQAINDGVLAANHKIIHRLAALGEAGQELSEEFHIDIDRIKNPLPSAGIDSLDRLFEYFSKQFAENGINFSLEVNGDIPYMTERIIPKGKLETLIGDHLQDAFIAVGASDNRFRAVQAVIGLTGDCYGFTVSDSGIPFEVNTLARLGMERVTTHADTGGSGIGFMTTFETMRECKASLIINENPSGGYTKSVTIRFDGKGGYIIETCRPGEFPVSGRYKVVDISGG